MSMIANEEFAIWRTIQECPGQEMFVREVFHNAISATKSYIENNDIKTFKNKSGNKAQILARGLKLPPVFGSNINEEKSSTKLSILNYGGLTYSELLSSAKLFSSVGKTQGDMECFGVGSKVSLAQFTTWLVITYKYDPSEGEHKAHFIWLGIDFNTNKFQIFSNVDENDCTEMVKEQAKYRGYDLNHDFYELILVGKYDTNEIRKCNTVTHPFGLSEDKLPGHFISRKLLERFVDVPKNIEIKLAKGLHSQGKGFDMSSATLEEAFLKMQSTYKKDKLDPTFQPRFDEAVSPNGVKVKLMYDPIRNDRGETMSQTHTQKVITKYLCALEHGKEGEKERYNVVSETRSAINFLSKLGIRNKHECFKVFVEVPFSKAQPGTYRDILRSVGSLDKNGLKLTDYLNDVKEVLSKITWWQELVNIHNGEVKRPELKDWTEQFWNEVFPGINPNSKRVAEVRNTSKDQEEEEKKVKEEDDEKKKKKEITTRTFKRKQFKLSFDIPFLAAVDKEKKDMLKGNFVVCVPDDNGGLNDVIYYDPEHSIIKALEDRLYNSGKRGFDKDTLDILKEEIRENAIKALGSKVSVWFLRAKQQRNQRTITEEEFRSHIQPSTTTAFTSIPGYEYTLLEEAVAQLVKDLKNAMDEDDITQKHIETNLTSDATLLENKMKKWTKDKAYKSPAGALVE